MLPGLRQVMGGSCSVFLEQFFLPVIFFTSSSAGQSISVAPGRRFCQAVDKDLPFQIPFQYGESPHRPGARGWAWIIGVKMVSGRVLRRRRTANKPWNES